jgi:PAS domain S-box-containing protein
MDIRTVLVCLFIINLFLGALIYVLKKTYRDFKEAGFWIVTCFLIATGYLLLSLRSVVPDFLSIVIANIAFFLAGIYRIVGFTNFFKQKNTKFQRIGFGISLPLYLSLFIYFTYFQNSIFIRTTISGVVLSAISCITGLIILKQKPKSEAFIYNFTASTFFLFSIIFTSRIIGWVVFPSLRYFFNHAIINYLQFFASIMIDISWSFMFFIIYNNKISIKLIESEEKYRTIFEKNKSIITVIDPETGEIVDVNPATSEFYGYSKEELLKMTIGEINALPMDELKEEMKAAVAEKRNYFTFKHRKANGAISDVEVYSTPFKYQGKDILHSIIHDISDRKKNEVVISKLSKAIDSTQASIIITDINGVIEYANPYFTQLSGYGPDEYLGKNPKILKSGYHTKEFYKELWETILSGKTWEGEFNNIKKTGEVYWEKAIISPIKNLKDEIINFVAVKSDITESKKIYSELLIAKEKAEESDRLKTAFLQNMSHEIRTPMNAIMGFSDLLIENMDDKLKIESFANIINSRCEDLLDIMNDILEISRIESGVVSVKIEKCYINDLFNELDSYFKNQQNRLIKQHIEFTLEILCTQAEAVIYTDKAKLKQIFRGQ